jgi:hypothetical protein
LKRRVKALIYHSTRLRRQNRSGGRLRHLKTISFSKQLGSANSLKAFIPFSSKINLDSSFNLCLLSIKAMSINNKISSAYKKTHFIQFLSKDCQYHHRSAMYHSLKNKTIEHHSDRCWRTLLKTSKHTRLRITLQWIDVNRSEVNNKSIPKRL